MSLYVEAPDEYTGVRSAVFLAGGITDCPDWQADAREMLEGLPVVVLNPRRANFPIHDPSAAAAQIDWEFRHLRRADVVLFWFPASPSPQPIALYELGFHASAGKPLAVGAEPGYPRRTDVLEQLAHARPEVKVHDTLAGVCEEAENLLAAGLPFHGTCNCEDKEAHDEYCRQGLGPDPSAEGGNHG